MTDCADAFSKFKEQIDFHANPFQTINLGKAFSAKLLSPEIIKQWPPALLHLLSNFRRIVEMILLAIPPEDRFKDYTDLTFPTEISPPWAEYNHFILKGSVRENADILEQEFGMKFPSIIGVFKAHGTLQRKKDAFGVVKKSFRLKFSKEDYDALIPHRRKIREVLSAILAREEELMKTKERKQRPANRPDNHSSQIDPYLGKREIVERLRACITRVKDDIAESSGLGEQKRLTTDLNRLTKELARLLTAENE